MPRMLDLFSGTGSVSSVFAEHEWQVETLDINPAGKPTYCVDILKWDYKAFSRNRYDFIWASPTCRTWSYATHKHRTTIAEGAKPKTEEAKEAELVVLRLLEILEYFKCKWVMENPRGYLQHYEPVKRFLEPPLLVWYGNYDFPWYKPTHLWSNFPLWAPEEKQKKQNYKKFAAGSEGLKTYDERITVPRKLVERVYHRMMTMMTMMTA